MGSTVLAWRVQRGNDRGSFAGCCARNGLGARGPADRAGAPLSPSREPRCERHVLVLRQARRLRAQVLQQGLLDSVRRGSGVRFGSRNSGAGLTLAPRNQGQTAPRICSQRVWQRPSILERKTPDSWRWQTNWAPESRCGPLLRMCITHPSRPAPALPASCYWKPIRQPIRHSRPAIGHLPDIVSRIPPGIEAATGHLSDIYRTSIGQAEELAGQAVGQALSSRR